jgi:phosphoribosylglycinamide formyltransferase
MDACSDGRIPDAQISLVLSNRKAAYGLKRAEDATPPIPTDYLALAPFLKGPPISRADGSLEALTRRDYDLELVNRILRNGRPDLIVLAGWMHILSHDFLSALNPQHNPESAEGLVRPIPIINLHPALPGAFDGANAIHRAFEAFKAGETTKTGVMVHMVIPEVDRGEPIVVQEVPILESDTLETLEERIHVVEHSAIVKAAAQVLMQT